MNEYSPKPVGATAEIMLALGWLSAAADHLRSEAIAEKIAKDNLDSPFGQTHDAGKELILLADIQHLKEESIKIKNGEQDSLTYQQLGEARIRTIEDRHIDPIAIQLETLDILGEFSRE